MSGRKEYWDNIYKEKNLSDVSWYEPTPETSLSYIAQCKLPKDAAIIDIGGGESLLVDFLLDMSFTNISVLDISKEAIEKAQRRLGQKAEKIQWIVSDVLEFIPEKEYDLWHDRAAFHFLTEEVQVEKYLEVLENAVSENAFVVLSTFSESGPEKCSGLDIKRYSLTSLVTLFSQEFNTMSCSNVDHRTPSGATQNFSYCSFKRKNKK